MKSGKTFERNSCNLAKINRKKIALISISIYNERIETISCKKTFAFVMSKVILKQNIIKKGNVDKIIDK